MKKWDLIVDESTIGAYINEIRKSCNKRPYSNCEMMLQYKYDSKGVYPIKCCICEKNLTILECKNEIWFMNYYWGEIEAVSIDFPDDVESNVVCEIVEIEGKERQQEVVKYLLDYNFTQYKKYYKWELTKDDFKCGIEGELIYKMEYDSLVEDTIYKVFDPLSDQLPQRNRFIQYCSEARLLSAYDKNIFVGGVVFHVNGRVAVEEYIFTTDDARGRGYATNIQNKFLKHCFESACVNKVYAWIEENNIISLELHKKVGYIRRKENKSTFIWRKMQ